MRIFKFSTLRVMVVFAGLSVAMVDEGCGAFTSPSTGKGSDRLTSLDGRRLHSSGLETAPTA